MISKEKQIEDHFINKLIDLKYTYRDDIRDRNALERNFRTKFEALNRVHLTDSEFDRLLEEIIDADVLLLLKDYEESIRLCVKTGHHYNTCWSISKIGVRMIMR